MAHTAILIAGSPTANSRSTSVLEAIGRELVKRGWETRSYSVNSFPSDALLHGRFDAPEVVRFAADIKSASALLFSTPVYKATYAGALKVIVDLIDPKALAGKALLGIATARLEAHLAEVDVSFQRLYAFFAGALPLQTLALLDPQLGPPGELRLDAAAQQSFETAVSRLVGAVA
ncbi:MAG: NAD(P)H-dependent oxidoreductase [Myxococcota bacterium]